MLNLYQPTLFIYTIQFFLIIGCGGGGGGGATTATDSSGSNTLVFTPDSPNQTYTLSVFDLNSDGMDDVFVSGLTNSITCSGQEAYHYVLIQQSNGDLKDDTSEYLSDINRHCGNLNTLYDDFDGDGNKDIFLAPLLNSNTATSAFTLWGDGITFTKESYSYNLASEAACSFDLNSDGNVDIFLSDSSGANLGGWVQRSGLNQLTSPADKNFFKNWNSVSTSARSCLIISSGGNNILILSSTANKKIIYSTDPVTESNFVNTSNIFNRMLSIDLTSAVDNDIVAFSNDKIFVYENLDNGSFREIYSDNLNSSSYEVREITIDGTKGFVINGESGDLHVFKGTNEITSNRANVMASGGNQGAVTVYKTSSGNLKILQQINGVFYTRDW
jgi:hypothetical protein